jgi:hypothetical protein
VNREFNAYVEWLQIPPAALPPDHYQLLGVPRFESDATRIEECYLDRFELVRKYETSPSYSDVAICLLEELSRAKQTLRDRDAKVEYDAKLKRALAPAEPQAVVEEASTPPHTSRVESGKLDWRSRENSRRLGQGWALDSKSLAIGAAVGFLLVPVLLRGWFSSDEEQAPESLASAQLTPPQLDVLKRPEIASEPSAAADGAGSAERSGAPESQASAAVPTVSTAASFDSSSSSGAPTEASVPSPPFEEASPEPPVGSAPAEPPQESSIDAAPAEIGRYISENEVLARFDGAQDAWMRASPNATLYSTDRLLALPAFRPKLVLASGLQITLSGGTLVEFKPAPPSATASLGIEYGRLIVSPGGASPGVVHLDLWGRRGEITFAGPESIMAIQLRRYRSPGVDPEAGWAHRMVEIYAIGGNLLWREAGHPDQQISAGEIFAFLDDVRGAVVPAEAPLWVTTRDVSRVDELASQRLEEAVDVGRGLAVQLLRSRNIASRRCGHWRFAR